MSKDKLPAAIYSGTLPIGDIEIDCAVLEDGTRVLRAGCSSRIRQQAWRFPLATNEGEP